MNPQTGPVPALEGAEAIRFVFDNASADAAADPPGILAAGLVHDLGNLIQIAAAAINIVARTPDMPAVHSGPILARAKFSLEQAGAIVRQSGDFIRDRAMAVDDTCVVACLADVAAVVVTKSETGPGLRFEVAPDLPKVRGDPVGLRRAVLNLVLNARAATAGGGGGDVAITARSIRHGLVAAGVEIRVADSGVGMSPAIIARAFDPFFTTKSDGLGGVGLSVVERFVRDARGEIAIESELGVGTTVTLILPAGGSDLPFRTEFTAEESDR